MKPYVLCVDDEQMILNVLGKILRHRFGSTCGFEFAESGDEALEIMEELVEQGSRVAMVISDQIMPGMNGDELLAEIHRRDPDCVKILLTGQAALDSAINAVNNANLYRYHTKPWDDDDLLLTVEKGLQEYQLKKDLIRQIEMFQRFVPGEFLRFLGKSSILEIELGDQVQKQMAVLFSDIRSFTTLSERMKPVENFSFINSYLGRVGPIIQQHGGFIDKYVGDALMALFPNEVDDAVRAAIEMQRSVELYNTHRAKSGYEKIAVGVGLHVGELMLGMIGYDLRMQSTVISDAVNTASRIEGLTKYYHSSILVSDQTMKSLKDASQFRLRLLGRVPVKGKQDAIAVHEILDGESEKSVELKLKTRPEFEEGIDLYFQERFAEAGVHFDRVLKINPADQAASIYLSNSARMMVNGVAGRLAEQHLVDSGF